MKRIFLKVLSLFLCLSVVGILSGCNLKGLTADEAKANLEAAGYTVTVREGEEFVNSGDCQFDTIFSTELEKYLYAVKGEDKIYMYFFYFIETASSNYDFMHMDGLKSGQNNKTVYFGTKQAIKDSKI